MIRFRLNGADVTATSPPLTRLLDVLRDELKDVSVKDGCGEGECGACAVIKDGLIVNSCLIPVIQVEGSDIQTIAGLKNTDRGRMLIDCFSKEGAVQCGFCTPGMIIAAEALLGVNPKPNEYEIREAISGNLCRCTGYDLIIKAIASAAEIGKGLW
jgi:aerobic carbon-monoxide dehydrogenase small subunit